MTGVGGIALAVLPLTLLGQELAVGDLVPLDRTVVAIVLDDLVAYRGKDSPIDEIFSPKPLTLDPTPDRYPRTVDELLHQYDVERWKGLSPVEGMASRAAAADLVRRITASPESFTAGSKHVPLYAGGDPKAASFGKSPIQGYLPGYSKDRRLAIIRLHIPWSIHGCYATYVLARTDTTWEVRVREFACYV